MFVFIATKKTRDTEKQGMNNTSGISAKQLLKDLDVLSKVVQLRVNTWTVLGSGCCMDYHASAGEFSLEYLIRISDNLVMNNAWVQSYQCREIERMASGRKQENWSPKTRQLVQEYLQSFCVDPQLAARMQQQVMFFHFRMAELLEELSPQALAAVQQVPRMRDVITTWQQALVQRSRVLSVASSASSSSADLL